MPPATTTAASNHGHSAGPWAGAISGGADWDSGALGAAVWSRVDAGGAATGGAPRSLDPKDGSVGGAARGAAGRACVGGAARALSPERTGALRDGSWIGWKPGFVGVGVVVAGGGVSAGRVTLPPRLKFWSSRGPTVVAGVLLVAGGGLVCGGALWVVFCGTVWASAGDQSQASAANASIPKRNPAFIRIRFCRESRDTARVRSHAASRVPVQAWSR